MGCVRGRRPPAGLCGRVVLLLIMVMEARVISGGGPDVTPAQDCVMYVLQENSSSLVFPFSRNEIILSIQSENTDNLSGLVLGVKSELGSLWATFNVSTQMVQCHNNSHNSHGYAYYDGRHTGKWWHATISVKNHYLCIDNTAVCEGSEIHGSNLTLTVRSYTGSSHIVFNCEHGCHIKDDAAIISLEHLSRNMQFYVKNASANATATLRLFHFCESSDDSEEVYPCDDQPKDMNLEASDLNGHWSPLLFKTKEMTMDDMKRHITVLTVGDMMDIFFTLSNDSLLKVVNSSNMFWTADCDPRKQVKVDLSIAYESSAEGTTTDSESSCEDWYWKGVAVFLVLMVLILLSFIAVILISRYHKKWKRSVEDSKSHFLVDKSEHSENSQTLELRTSQNSCSPTVLPPNSNSNHNGCNDIMSNYSSKDEKNKYPKMFPPPPSSPPPPPNEIKDSFFPMPVEPLHGTAQEPNDNEDDDVHDYDYLNINLLQQQLNEDKEEKDKKELGGEETKMEEQRKSETEAKVTQCCYDSMNSLYEPFNTTEVVGTSVDKNGKTN